MRKCKKCFETKPLTDFLTFSKNNTGKRYECKVCTKNRTRKWREENTYIRYKKNSCENCGFIPIHSCQLDVDHINGNHEDDAESNLRTLCANCHRLKSYINKETRYKRNN